MVDHHLVNKRVCQGCSLPPLGCWLIWYSLQPSVQPTFEVLNSNTIQVPQFLRNQIEESCPPHPECRGKYFANSRPFRGGRVSINVIIPVEFVYKRIRAFLLIHKLYRNHAFVCLLGEYYNPSVPKWTKYGN